MNIFSKEDINGSQAHEMLLNLTNNHGNENENHMRSHLTSVRVAIIKKTRDNKCWSLARKEQVCSW